MLNGMVWGINLRRFFLSLSLTLDILLPSSSLLPLILSGSASHQKNGRSSLLPHSVSHGRHIAAIIFRSYINILSNCWGSAGYIKLIKIIWIIKVLLQGKSSETLQIHQTRHETMCYRMHPCGHLTGCHVLQNAPQVWRVNENGNVFPEVH